MKKIGNTMKAALPLVGGGIAAKLVKNLSGKFITNDKLRAAVPLVLGVMLASQKGAMMKDVGMGMIAVGGADLAGSVIPGLAGLEDADLSGIFGDVLNGPGEGEGVFGDVLNGPGEGEYMSDQENY